MIRVDENYIERLEYGLRNCKKVYEKNYDILHDFIYDYLKNIFEIYNYESHSYLNENHYMITFNLPKLFNEIQVASLVLNDIEKYFQKLLTNYHIDDKFIIVDIENMKLTERIRVTLSERNYK